MYCGGCRHSRQWCCLSCERRQRGAETGGLGGWWILVEVDVELETHEVYRPDVTGWRRETHPARPAGRPVPHYWIVDPERELLVVHRWEPQGYLTALTAGRGETVRAEPFDAVELPVDVLFGDDA